MNGFLAQAAALAAHAQARRLNTSLGGDEAYWRQHSTFRYVRQLRFTVRNRRLFRSSEVEVATTPPQWMATLSSDARISLISIRTAGALERYIASAFVGDEEDG